MGQDMVVPRKLLVSDSGRFGMEFHIAALPGPPPLPSSPHPASSYSPTAQPEAHPLGRALSQLSANGDAIPSARAQLATPQDSVPSPRVAEEEKHTAPLVTASPSYPAAVPAHEHASHQSRLVVYQSRRRYQSAPASPRDFQNWMAKQEQHLQATSHVPTREESSETPGISAVFQPGVQDMPIAEMMRVIEVATAAGDYAPTP